MSCSIACRASSSGWSARAPHRREKGGRHKVMLQSPDILVPVDFSDCSINAVRAAAGIATPEGDLTLLHVIDEDFIKDAVAAGLGASEEITARMRERAEADFA